jgi:ligand-binding sensor domain-containing protein
VTHPRSPIHLTLVACIGFLHADPSGAQPPRRDDPSPAPAPPTTSPAAQPTHDPALQISAYIRCIFQGRDGRLWMGTNSDGVCMWDGKSLASLGVKDGLAGNAVRKIVQTADGAMWFTTEGGVSRYHAGTFTTYTVADGLSSNDTWSMMLDSRGTLWVGTREGVCRHVGAGDAKAEPKADKRFEAFPLPRAEVETPASRFDPRLVWSMIEDRDGNIWFGTDGEGARKHDGTTFTTYTTKDGLAGNQVRSILADRHGQIWFGCEAAGASRFDGATFRTFDADDGLGNNRVYTMYEDRTGNLWFSTLADGVTRYDGTTFTVHRQLGGLPRTHVQSILQDKDGTLWFGCSGGLFRLDGTTFVNVTKDGPWR